MRGDLNAALPFFYFGSFIHPALTLSSCLEKKIEYRNVKIMEEL